MSSTPFASRQEAGRLLGERLRALPLRNPLVLAIPRGGVEIGAPLARAIGAELDIVLSRKLRAPYQPELALGAVSETGEVYLDPHAGVLTEPDRRHIETERRTQMDEIGRRQRLFREVRPHAPVAGRSVIVTDDGIATGSTMIAALRTVRAEGAHEIIVAVPVAPRDRLDELGRLADRVICLRVPETFWAIGQFYRDFAQVPDERVVEVLREFAPAPPAGVPVPTDG